MFEDVMQMCCDWWKDVVSSLISLLGLSSWSLPLSVIIIIAIFSAGRVQIGLQGYTRFTITSSRHNSLPFWDSRQHAFPTRIQSVNKDCVSMEMWCQKISIKDNLINICTLDTWQTILLFLSGLQIRRTLNRSCAWLPHLLKIHHQD